MVLKKQEIDGIVFLSIEVDKSLKMTQTQSRTKNTTRNIFFGIINKIIVLLLPFVVRTIIIYKLGAEYVGLNSLFVSILQVLSVAELGFASAISFSLYGPVSRNETGKIIQLVTLLKTIYFIVGCAITVVGLSLMPFIKFFIKDSPPDSVNVYILYVVYLANTVISYFVFGYKNSILNAFQRYDVISKINSVVEIIKGAFSISVLLLFKNYYVYVALLPAFTLLSNLLTGFVTNKMYPELRVPHKMSLSGAKDIKKQLGGIAIGRISLVCRNSFDSIIISTLLGLTITAIYANYYIIFSSITAFFGILLTSMAASVGNSLVTEPIEKNEKDHIKFDFYYMFLISACTICLFGLYQPFMEVWTHGELLFPYFTMTLFCVYFYFTALAQVRSVYSEAAGLWWHFRYFAIGEMVANLGLNILLGYFWGVNGILLATIITSFVSSFICITIVTYKKLFKMSPAKYYLNNAIYLLIVVVICLGVHFAISFVHLEGWAMLFASGGISLGACLVLLVIYLIKKDTRQYIFEFKKFIRRGK